MPKKTSSKRAQRHDPLEKQIRADQAKQFASTKSWKKSKVKGKKYSEDEERDVVPSDMSRKILSFAKEQLDEDKLEREKEKTKTESRKQRLSDDEDEEEEDDEFEVEYLNENEFEQLELNRDDERALEAFMSRNKPERRTLADIIMEKIKEKEQRAAREAAEGGAPAQTPGLNDKLAEVYNSIGGLLSRYRSGKLPKAFKIIPALRNWEEVVYHTDPDGWSPQAMRAATRLFASNLNPKMAQRFYALILIPAVRDDIARNKKLNYHLYMALKKSIYRPASFFKGILLPLCEEGDCTLREAAIIGSVLSKVSIPMMHSAAAMLKMASMPYSGATSLFLRVLLNKKYSLPFKVIDILVHHFLAFKRETRELPVLWHQALLVFAQRYKTSLTAEQKDAFKPLLKQHFHYQITAEIRRELYFSTSRNK